MGDYEIDALILESFFAEHAAGTKVLNSFKFKFKHLVIFVAKQLLLFRVLKHLNK